MESGKGGGPDSECRWLLKNIHMNFDPMGNKNAILGRPRGLTS